MSFIDITGQTFNYLTALNREPNIGPYAMFKFKCICNNEKILKSRDVRRGTTKSCGCKKLELCGKTNYKHGHAKPNKNSLTYKTYMNMLMRCYNKNHSSYQYYGSRNIKICDRWLGKEGFTNFLKDMGERSKNTEIDRYPDKNGDYELSNCRWATRKENTDNRNCTIYLEYKGLNLLLSEWSLITKIKYNVLERRLYHKWTIERILTSPVKYKHKFIFNGPKVKIFRYLESLAR